MLPDIIHVAHINNNLYYHVLHQHVNILRKTLYLHVQALSRSGFNWKIEDVSYKIMPEVLISKIIEFYGLANLSGLAKPEHVDSHLPINHLE